MCLALVACLRQDSGVSGCREGETWKAVKLPLCRSLCPLASLSTSKCSSLYKEKPHASHCSYSRRGCGESAWVSIVDAPLFPICTLILSQAPTWTVTIQSVADISIYTGGGWESGGICVRVVRVGGVCLILFLPLCRKKRKKKLSFPFCLIHGGFFHKPLPNILMD